MSSWLAVVAGVVEDMIASGMLGLWVLIISHFYTLRPALERHHPRTIRTGKPAKGFSELQIAATLAPHRLTYLLVSWSTGT